jgi:hypothetical protein
MAKRMEARTGAIGVLVLLILLAATSSSATARPKPISGKLSKPGYTVIALAANGKARTVRATPRIFKLQPPAKRVTLHLRARDGTYAGPIVVARQRRGRRAILGVKAGAKLGKVRIRRRRAYASLERGLPRKLIDAKRMARARRGVPIGAGSFGRVRSKNFREGAPGDLDLDGIPNPLDIDDDGDLIIDNLDRSTGGRGARAAQAAGCGPNNVYCQPVASAMAPGLKDTVNVNALAAAGFTAAQIQQNVDTILAQQGFLQFGPLSPTAELDCGGEPNPVDPDGWIGGLSYCTRGGTGLASFGPGGGPPFPGSAGSQFDPDGDGFGTLPAPAFIAHRATTAEIETGQPLTQRDDATQTEAVTTLNFVFVTVPALVAYSDTAGNCAKVSGTPGPCATEFSYPVSPGDIGNPGNGFPVSAPPGEDVKVTLTFWRPQRQPIPRDPPGADWMDIGQLIYSAYAPAAGHPAVSGGCPQTAFSDPDPNLRPPEIPLLGTGGFEDRLLDQVSSQGNTLTYTLNLSQCLAANGLSFLPGEEQGINFMAVAGATDTSEQQGIFFERQ